MIGKRIAAHLLNKIIIFIPAMLLLGAVFLIIDPNNFIFGKDEAGWLILYLYRYLLFLPTVFLDLVRQPSEFMSILEIIVPALMSFAVIEIISISLIKRDIGMKIMGLTLVSTNEQPVRLTQIIGRTLLKYFSLAFFPFVLLYVFFNKERMTLHDKISNTRVVQTQKQIT